MARLLLLLGLALLPAGAAAEDLRESMTGLLRSRDCVMATDALTEVYTVMGHAPEEVAAAMEGLVADGTAVAAPAGSLTLTPEACHPPIRVRVRAGSWVTDRLDRIPGCRMPLRDLARQAEAEGLAAEDFEEAIRDLASAGRVLQEGAQVALRPDLCGPGTSPHWQLDRAESMGLESYRAVLGFLALERGCRLDLSDREALVWDLSEMAAQRFFLGQEVSDEAMMAIAEHVREALDDPGPAYRADPAAGELVFRYCAP